MVSIISDATATRFSLLSHSLCVCVCCDPVVWVYLSAALAAAAGRRLCSVLLDLFVRGLASNQKWVSAARPAVGPLSGAEHAAARHLSTSRTAVSLRATFVTTGSSGITLDTLLTWIQERNEPPVPTCV